MKKGKTKAEQLFQLIIGAVMCLIVLCVTGCGGNSCECVKVGCEDGRQGISVPGLGGCFSSGKGCDSCLWAQSCKWLCVEDKQLTKEVGELTKQNTCITACDVRYYDGSCLGCGNCFSGENPKEKSCVSGCGCTEDGKGLFYENDNKGCMFGCFDGYGCFGCTDSDISTTFGYAEEELGID